MSNTPTLDSLHSKHTDWILLHVLFYGLLLILVGPFTLLLSFLFPRLNYSRKVYTLFSLISLLWLLAVPGLVASFVDLWVLSIPLAPVGSVLLKGFKVMALFSKPRSLQEQLEEAQQWQAARSTRQAAQANRATWAKAAAGKIRLGAKLKGEMFPEWLGVEERGDWIGLDEGILDQHIFVLGTTGAGKSETIKRLVYEILAATDRHIYFVDGKGDEALANDIRSLAYHFDRGKAPVFKLGFDRSGAIYDGFQGQSADIYNRLLALVGVHEVEGNAQYYADINRTILQYICKASVGPPRSFGEVLQRINQEWLSAAYSKDPHRQKRIESIKSQHFESLLFRLIPLTEDFEAVVGPEGFSLENTACAIFSMRVQSVGDTSKHFLDFMVEDLKDFVGKRQKHPAVLIIDEFGQFSNDNIISLLTLARSSKLSVILATQDTASLKDEATKKLVLANTRTKILMVTDFPEEIAELAGTRYQVESSFQHQDGDITGLGSSRVQHAYKIDMNEAAQLRPGEAFLIRQRYAAKVKVKAIGEIQRVPEQREEKRTVQKATTARTETAKRRPPKLL